MSVIMPSYNCGRYVEESIRSVQAQTYRNWEIIFVDDCSTDDTKSIVQKLMAEDERIKFLQNEKNSGAAVSRNYALRKAKGKWIAFLDSDDLWIPEKLEHQIRFMEDNGYSFSYTEYLEMDEESRSMGVSISGPQRVTKAGMYAYCWPGCLTVMYDASVVGLVQIEDIRKNNDYAMWLKICRKVDCYLLDECLAKYRIRKGSLSNHNYAAMIKWHFRLFKDALGLSTLVSVGLTALNLICGAYKKIEYRNNIKRQVQMKNLKTAPPSLRTVNALHIESECLTYRLAA